VPVQGKTRRVIQAVVALGLTAAVTAVFRPLADVNVTTVGFVYLLVVLAAASLFGFPEALLASLAAAAQYNYFFLPPTYTFTIADTRNWVALAAFLITATVASELSALAKRQAREAELRRRELNRLYELTRAGLLADPEHTAPQLERALVTIFGLDDARIEPAAAAGAGGRWPLRMGQNELGVLRLQPPPASPESGEAIASVVAIALERARALREASHLHGVRESEALKTALLDSVTHDLRTPLTSIKAAVSSLRSELMPPERSDAEARGELLAVIDEESDRLNQILQHVLDMARIEAGGLRLAPAAQAIAPILEAAMAQARLPAERIQLDIASDLPLVRADGPLISQAIAQLLTNAAAYSSPGSPIEIAAAEAAGGVTVAVRDRGPGIPAEQMPRIFEKFYRDPRARQLRPEGLGMGLGIARGIIQAHQAELRVDSQPGEGSRFWFTLPLAADAPVTHGQSHTHR